MADSGADTGAAAAAGAAHAQHQDETRLILLPVDLDDASITAINWTAKHVLRKGARARALRCLRRLLGGDTACIATRRRSASAARAAASNVHGTRPRRRDGAARRARIAR
jgi:hypothetical protein